MAGQYLFWRMPKVDKAWCPYCIVDALMHFATVAINEEEILLCLLDYKDHADLTDHKDQRRAWVVGNDLHGEAVTIIWAKPSSQQRNRSAAGFCYRCDRRFAFLSLHIKNKHAER